MTIEQILKKCLFGSEREALAALSSGQPAAILMSGFMPKHGGTLHVCFDWDSTIVDDSADKEIASIGRPAFTENEWGRKNEPCLAGPLYPLFAELAERDDCILSIVTARVPREVQRVISTLDAWGIEIGALHSCGSAMKGPFVKGCGAHLFFDDLPSQIESTARLGIPSARVPYGPSTWQ